LSVRHLLYLINAVQDKTRISEFAFVEDFAAADDGRENLLADQADDCTRDDTGRSRYRRCSQRRRDGAAGSASGGGDSDLRAKHQPVPAIVVTGVDQPSNGCRNGG
jgi:hypothetical protein